MAIEQLRLHSVPHLLCHRLNDLATISNKKNLKWLSGKSDKFKRCTITETRDTSVSLHVLLQIFIIRKIIGSEKNWIKVITDIIQVLWHLNSMSSAMFFARFCSNWIRELKGHSIVADIFLVFYSFEQNCIAYCATFNSNSIYGVKKKTDGLRTTFFWDFNSSELIQFFLKGRN